MKKRKIVLLAASFSLLVGCPYIDHGMSYAPDRVVKSIDEIQGCYYREYLDNYEGLVCKELCIDSLAHHIVRSYGKGDDGKYTVLKRDTSFFKEVEIKKPVRDGNLEKAFFIENVGFFDYSHDASAAKLVGIRGNDYSTKREGQCEF
ncbi:MAG: hypothetical protein MJZ05_02640 [Fibrobacter sp.]|nr:hypothetical protein [Fibrobacter sp.]